MITIDKRFCLEDINLLKTLKNKVMVCIEHDPFLSTNTSSQVVKLKVSDSNFYVYNLTEPVDYFGTKEDVSILSFEEKEYPFLKNKELIKDNINQTIKGITVVHETQKLFDGPVQLYNVMFTRGIIFELEDEQLSFEKSSWLSEDIYIQKGDNLISKFTPATDFSNTHNWESGLKAEYSRELIEL